MVVAADERVVVDVSGIDALGSLRASLGHRDPWRQLMPGPQVLPDDLLEEGRGIPIARVQAMHEGKRRARAKRQ